LAYFGQMNAIGEDLNKGPASWKGPFVVVTSLFFMWGFITVLVDALIPRLKDVFELELWQAGLVQFAWFGAYGLVSIPGGNLIERIGYKRGILVGLGLAGLGCLLFYPAAGTRMYGIFLLALFVVAAGITILQVAANPYISVLGDSKGASSRLNLAQAFNSLGTTIAPLVAAGWLLSDKILNSAEQESLSVEALETYRMSEASAVQGPFVVLALAFAGLAALIAMARLPQILGSSAEGTYAQVLRNKRLLGGAIGIFVYVGAEVAIGSYMVNYGLELGVAGEVLKHPVLRPLVDAAAWLKGGDAAGMDAKAAIGALLTFYWGGAMIGRFVGSGLMQRWRPGRILGIFAVVAAFLVLASALTSGIAALTLLLGVGLMNSVMFPTIFTLAIDELGDMKPLGSGVLCTAIVGGAVIPPAMGAMAGSFGFSAALFLPMICYVYIAWYGQSSSVSAG
jgi:FHS family L-fucose permease-like MFS transporter